MSGLLRLSGLTLRAGGVVLIPPLDLRIEWAEFVAVIGESGSGKTLLGRAMAGLLPTGIAADGRIAVAGQSPADWRAVWGRCVAHLGQDARAALNPLAPVGAQIRAVMQHHGTGGSVAARLAEVGLPPALAKARPDALSGGQCQLVALACVLATPARLIVVDEPTSALDGPASARVMALLRARVAAGGGVVMMTHDLAHAAGADRIVVLHAGQLAEDRRAEDLLATPRHPYTAALMAANPARAGALTDLRPLPGGLPDLTRPDLPACRFAARCMRAQAVCRVEVPAMAGGVACHAPEGAA